MFLIWAFFLLLLKYPDTQMTCNTPKMWPHFGCNKQSFVSSLLVYLYFAKRHRGTSCLGSEWDQGVRNNELQHADSLTVEVEECSQCPSVFVHSRNASRRDCIRRRSTSLLGGRLMARLRKGKFEFVRLWQGFLVLLLVLLLLGIRLLVSTRVRTCRSQLHVAGILLLGRYVLLDFFFFFLIVAFAFWGLALLVLVLSGSGYRS